MIQIKPDMVKLKEDDGKTLFVRRSSIEAIAQSSEGDTYIITASGNIFDVQGSTDDVRMLVEATS